MAVFSLIFALLFICSVLANDCPRTNVPKRQCGQRCLPPTGCDGTNKKCICDGDCGYSCVLKDICNKISQIPNGVTRRHSTIHGAKATFYCQRGYRLIGKPKLTCYFGNWSDSIPKCTVVNCGDRGSLKNGKTIAINGYTYDKKISFSCDQGYVLRGSPFAICRENGRWSKVLPQCQALCTQLPHISNGVTRRHSGRHGSKVSFYCTRGYRITGKPKITCNNGRWSDSLPQCTAVNCGDPGSPRNGKTITNNGYTYNEKVSFSCNNGYVLKGSPSAICRENGKWSKVLPICQVLCMKLHHIPNGFTRRHSTVHGAKASFYCRRGYKLVGKPKIICNNGAWSPSPPKCAAINCGNPGNPVNGSTIAENGYGYGKKITFLCHNGYVIKGSPFAICRTHGKWSKSLPECQALCLTLPKIKDGFTGRHSGRHGSKVSFSCRRGYKLTGKSKITCSNGAWSHSLPNCTVIICGDPGNPINGKTIAKNGFTYRKKVLFLCNRGYGKKGSRSAICRSHGKWSKALPKCTALCPKLPTTISNGFVVNRNARHSSKAWFFCRRGYELIGTSTISCNNGSWSSLVPRCTRKDNNVIKDKKS